MTKVEVLESVDKTRPNMASYDTKLVWLNTIEKQIFDHMTQFKEAQVSLSEDELLLGTEYKDMYVYYVVSMIDLANQDIAMYNNSCSFFNEAFLDWKKKWRREHLPLETKERG